MIGSVSNLQYRRSLWLWINYLTDCLYMFKAEFRAGMFFPRSKPLWTKVTSVYNGAFMSDDGEYEVYIEYAAAQNRIQRLFEILSSIYELALHGGGPGFSSSFWESFSHTRSDQAELTSKHLLERRAQLMKEVERIDAILVHVADLDEKRDGILSIFEKTLVGESAPAMDKVMTDMLKFVDSDLVEFLKTGGKDFSEDILKSWKGKK